MKKLISLLLIMFLFTPLCHAAIEGHIERTDTQNKELDKKLFTGEVETLEAKDVIKMTVSQVLSAGYTQEGDEFFAEVSEDVSSDKGIIIPKGTIAHGKVQYMRDAKNLGRDGYIVMDFDYLVTPDGRQIPIQASISTKENLAKGTAKAIGEHVGYTLAGGVVGGFVALNLLGIEAAIASQGYTLAGGAAIGGVVGLTAAIMRKGDSVLIKPGDELKIKVLSNIDMPVFSKDAFRQEELRLDGLNVRINSIAFEKDPFGEDNTITLSLGIDNFSENTFSAFDIALINDTKSTFFPSPFGDTSLWFKNIGPGDRVAGKLSFCVNDRKKHHWLVFYDKKTKKPLAKYSIDNAKSDLDEKLADKKRKKRRK